MKMTSEGHKGTSHHFRVGMRVRAMEKSPWWPCGATGTVTRISSGVGECCTIDFDDFGSLYAVNFKFKVILPPPPQMRTHTCAYCAREQAIFDGVEV